MLVNPKLPKEEQIIGHLHLISEILGNISRDISHEMGPFKVQELKEIEVISDSPEVVQLKRQNKLLFITLITSVSVTAIIGLADILLRIYGK